MSSYRLSVIFEGRRRSVETSLEEFDFFSAKIGGKQIRNLGGFLELEGVVRVTEPGVAGNDVATMGQVLYVQNLANNTALDLITVSEDVETVRLLTALNAGEIVALDERLAYLESNRPVSETLESGVGGQTVFTFTTLEWEFDNTVDDVTVYIETDYQRIDKSGAQLEAYRKLSNEQLEFSETVPQGVDVTAKLSGPKFITPLAPKPFFRSDLDGSAVEIYNVETAYDIGTGRLKTYRDGLLLANSPIVGTPVERAIEKSLTEVELGKASTNDTIMAFVHQEESPTYRISVSGFNGTVFTVPTYTPGDLRLRVYRNGALMNVSGLGSISQQYLETGATSITFASLVSGDEVITVEYAALAPTWREDITGSVGAPLIFTGGNVYTLSDQKLQVSKNGLLMSDVDSGVGEAITLYDEDGNGQVALSVDAVATDVFSVIYEG